MKYRNLPNPFTGSGKIFIAASPGDPAPTINELAEPGDLWFDGTDLYHCTIEDPVTHVLTWSNRYPATLHAIEHITGGDDVIPDAIAGGNSGLMSGADKAKLDSLVGYTDEIILALIQDALNTETIIVPEKNLPVFLLTSRKDRFLARIGKQQLFSKRSLT